MAPDKVTVMVLKVNLQCSSCYKKVKKVLCKLPQIRDQVFEEKQNMVTITVKCCNPEKIRDKLCCMGGKAIKSIEIKDPPQPKEPEKPKPAEMPKEPEKPKPVEKPKEPEKPKPTEKPKEPEKPKEVEKPKPVEPEKPKSNGKPPKDDPPKIPEPAPKPPAPPQPEPVIIPEPVTAYPPVFPVPVCCGQCYGGYGGGPCHQGYGRPVPPPPGPWYDGCRFGYGYGANRGCYVSRCDYFSEENPSGCSIM